VTRDRIDGRGGGSVYPLATYSVNVFSSPHGQVAEGVFDRIPYLSTREVSLSTAARTLAAIDPDAAQYDDLESDVQGSTDHVRGELVAELVDAEVPEHDAEAALRTDHSTADEALMLTNGTTIERAAAAVGGPQASERLELRMETRLDDELSESAPARRSRRRPTPRTPSRTGTATNSRTRSPTASKPRGNVNKPNGSVAISAHFPPDCRSRRSRAFGTRRPTSGTSTSPASTSASPSGRTAATEPRGRRISAIIGVQA